MSEPKLSDTAAAALRALARLLSDGYTGCITLQCRSGGVSEFREERVRDLKREP